MILINHPKKEKRTLLRQPDKEFSRDVDFVHQNPMLVQDANKYEFDGKRKIECGVTV